AGRRLAHRRARLLAPRRCRFPDGGFDARGRARRLRRRRLAVRAAPPQRANRARHQPQLCGAAGGARHADADRKQRRLAAPPPPRRPAPQAASAQLAARPAAEAALPPLEALYQRAAADPPRLSRRRAVGGNGCRRRLHHRAGDDLSARHADGDGAGNLAFPDHLRDRRRHHPPGGRQQHGRCGAGADPAARRRHRRAIGVALGRGVARAAGDHPPRRRGQARLRSHGAARLPLLDRAGRAMIRCCALILALLILPAAARAEQPLLADLTSHLIAITTGFTGTSVVLFGATDGPGDIIIVVRGPERDVVVRQKRHLAGIWINAHTVEFTGVPSYYAVFSNRALDRIAPAGMQALHQIGIKNIRLDPRDPNRPADEIATFRTALLDEERRAGVWSERPDSVSFLGDRLFRATIAFPSNVPTGTYLVEVLLLREGNVISGQTTPLVVSEIGLNADLGEFALGNPWLYGILAVAGASLLGWLASLAFREA